MKKRLSVKTLKKQNDALEKEVATLRLENRDGWDRIAKRLRELSEKIDKV